MSRSLINLVQIQAHIYKCMLIVFPQEVVAPVQVAIGFTTRPLKI